MNARMLGVGDRVRCVKGSYKGSLGTVASASAHTLVVELDAPAERKGKLIQSGRDRWELESIGDHTDQR